MKVYIVMGAQGWDALTTPMGKLIPPQDGPQWFLPVFKERSEAEKFYWNRYEIVEAEVNVPQ